MVLGAFTASAQQYHHPSINVEILNFSHSVDADSLPLRLFGIGIGIDKKLRSFGPFKRQNYISVGGSFRLDGITYAISPSGQLSIGGNFTYKFYTVNHKTDLLVRYEIEPALLFAKTINISRWSIENNFLFGVGFRLYDVPVFVYGGYTLLYINEETRSLISIYLITRFK